MKSGSFYVVLVAEEISLCWTHKTEATKAVLLKNKNKKKGKKMYRALPKQYLIFN